MNDIANRQVVCNVLNEKANNDFSLNYIPMNIGFDKNIHKREVMKHNNIKDNEKYSS